MKIENTLLNKTTKVKVFPPGFCSEEISIYALISAYTDCCKRKGNKMSTMKFEANLMENIMDLYHDINNRTYEIGRSKAFVVTEPKVREIWCAEFRDRVVHHLVYNEIAEYFERRFIFDSYSCIKNKGTLFGAQRVYKFARQATNNWDKPAYYIKMDISNYFMSIDKNLLWNMLKGYFSDNSVIGYLLKKIIFNDFKNNCLIIKQWMFDLVPEHKSAWNIDDDKGLPIGNLTSQFLSNVYLNGLDQYIKQTLKVKYYGRYVDDFIIIDEDKSKLKYLEKKIKEYLINNLNLKIADNKTILDSIYNGVDFIGYKIKPFRFLIRVRLIKNLLRKLKNINNIPEHKIIPKFNSYLGLLRHCKNFKLRMRTCKNINNKINTIKYDKEYTKLISGSIYIKKTERYFNVNKY